MTTQPPTARSLGAAELLRSVGLMADGPVTWGRPVPSARPGVYIVEWPTILADAPVDLAVVGKWLERLDGLRLDGRRPTSRELAARLHEFWLPGQPIVYVGMTPVSIGGRVGALYRTPLGDRRPHAAGLWLKTLRDLDRARVWWAETTAVEEYEDALLSGFAAAVDASPEAAPRLPDRSVILPFANLQSPTGGRKAHGISGALEPAPPVTPAAGTTVVDVPAGAADGAEESGRVRPTERHVATRPQPRRTPTPLLAPEGVDRPAGTSRPDPEERAGTGAATLATDTADPAAAMATDAQATEPGATGSGATGPGARLRGAAAREDLAALNDAVQRIACRRLVRELTVAEAAAELVAIGFFRATRAEPVTVLREMLKAGVIEGGTQDADRRWTIRCLRKPI